MTSHPYSKYEDTEIWKIIKSSLHNLEENNDIEFTTTPEHIIGYICQELDKANIALIDNNE